MAPAMRKERILYNAEGVVKILSVEAPSVARARRGGAWQGRQGQP